MSAAEPMAHAAAQAAQLPLAGVRIVAVEQYGAGPFGTQHLADLGAEVIKIENPNDGGDVGRAVGPYFFGADDSHFYQSFNRNKKSVTLDLKKPDGREALRRLARDADVVFNNLRGDLPIKLGLTYAQLKDVNPSLVCGHLSAYGRTGSRAAAAWAATSTSACSTSRCTTWPMWPPGTSTRARRSAARRARATPRSRP